MMSNKHTFKYKYGTNKYACIKFWRNSATMIEGISNINYVVYKYTCYNPPQFLRTVVVTIESIFSQFHSDYEWNGAI